MLNCKYFSVYNEIYFPLNPTESDKVDYTVDFGQFWMGQNDIVYFIFNNMKTIAFENYGCIFNYNESRLILFI